MRGDAWISGREEHHRRVFEGLGPPTTKQEGDSKNKTPESKVGEIDARDLGTNT